MMFNLQNVAFSFEKSSNGQNHSSVSHHPIKKIPSGKISHSTGGGDPKTPDHKGGELLMVFVKNSILSKVFDTSISFLLKTCE